MAGFTVHREAFVTLDICRQRRILSGFGIHVGERRKGSKGGSKDCHPGTEREPDHTPFRRGHDASNKTLDKRFDGFDHWRKPGISDVAFESAAGTRRPTGDGGHPLILDAQILELGPLGTGR